MIESCGKSIQINYSDPIFSCREIDDYASPAHVSAACFRGEICFEFFSCTFELERKLRDGSVGVFMYFYLVYSPEFFVVGSGRKSTRKLFGQAAELIVLIEHEFLGNSTSPPFAFLSCPFQTDISLPFGKRLIGVLLDTHGCENPKSKSCATLTLCTCEHERK